MTDLDRFKEFYAKVGLELKLLTLSQSAHILIKIGADNDYPDDVNTFDKFEGYTGFYSVIEFSPEGKFISQGFYE